MKKLHVALAFVSLSSFLLVACGKKAGSSCKAGESTCIEKEKSLTCLGGKFVVVLCGGPLGCTMLGEHASCDDTVSLEGDHCMVVEEYAWTPDKKKALVCKSGKFVFYTHCRGAKACERTGREVQCDRGRQEIGDPCLTAGDHECAVDENSLLTCKDGRGALDKKCKCESHDDRVGCKD